VPEKPVPTTGSCSYPDGLETPLVYRSVTSDSVGVVEYELEKELTPATERRTA
jgi:hypothetical protein